MTEDQAFEAIKNAIRLENLSRETAAKVTKQLLEVFEEAKRMISRIDSGSPLREQRLRQVLQQLAPLFRGPNDRLYLELTSALREEVEQQAYWAEKFLDVAEKNVELQPVGVGVSPAAGQGPVNQMFRAGVTRAQLLALTDETEVLGQRLGELFGVTNDESHFINTQIDRIDKVVKKGFLAGETNDEIARNLRVASNAAIRDSRAIARTAVMDMSHRAHYREWDANSDRVVMWEFDATMDYRVCNLCYPNDGKRAKTREALINKAAAVPVHPNCRCSILPLTRTELELEKQDMEEGMTQSIVEVNKRKSDARGRVYKTPARVEVNGKRVKMTKSSRDIKAREGKRVTMADFIAQTTPDTRRQVLGVVRAKEFEYLTSDNRGPRRKDIEEALIQVTRADAKQLEKAQRSRSRRKKG